MGFAGHSSMAKLLGVCQVSVLHDVVHLLFGVVGLLLPRAARTATLFLVVGGVVHLLMWVYGLAVGMDSNADFVLLDTADNWLHFALGAGMVALGLVLPRRDEPLRAA